MAHKRRSIPEDMKVVDCANCGCRLRGHDNPPEYRHLLHAIAGRINGRPHCSACLTPHPVTYRGAKSVEIVNQYYDELSPWQENAVKQLEDG